MANNEFQIYVFSQGEYSDYRVLVHYQGPKDYDFTPFYEAFTAQVKIIDLWNARREEEIPSPSGLRSHEETKKQWQELRVKAIAWERVNPYPQSPFSIACKILESDGFTELNNITEINIDNIYVKYIDPNEKQFWEK